MTGRRLLVTSGKLQSLSLITKSHPGPWEGEERACKVFQHVCLLGVADPQRWKWVLTDFHAVAVSALLLCVWNMNTKEDLIICKGYMTFHLEPFRTSGQWGGHCPHAGQSSLCLYHWERVLWGLEQIEAFSSVLAVPTAVAQGAATIFFTSCGFAGLESEKPIFILILFEPISLISHGLLFTPALGHKEGPVMSC